MAAVYSRLFFAGTVTDGVQTVVPLSSLDGVIVIRTVRVVCASSLPSLSWAVANNQPVLFLYAQGVPGPFSDVQEARDVWTPTYDMTLNCTGADMDFWVSGYLLSA